MTRRRFLRYGGVGAASLFGGGVLAACGGDDDDDVASSAAPASEGTTGTSTAAADAVGIGFAYIGPVTDNGWTYTHDLGRLAIQEQFGDAVSLPYVENVPISAEASQTFEQLASTNQMVIANTEYTNFLSDVAERHPDVMFLECAGHTFLPNLSSFYVSHHYAGYLIGVAAGMLSESGQIGYIGAFPTPEAYNDTNSILLGARTINPEATVTSILVSSFFDPQKATQAADALIDGGADFLFAIMDEPAFLQVAEERGVWAASWNTDIRQFGPTAYVNTYQLDWRDYYVSQAQALTDGTWEPTEEVVLLRVDIGEWGDNVPQEVKDAVAAVQGTDFNPYTGPLSDSEGTVRLQEGETLSDLDAYSIDWAVEGITGVT